MKKLIIILMFLSVKAHGQFSENHAIYGSLAASAGTSYGFDYNLNYVFQEKYSFKIGASFFLEPSDGRPRDYEGGGLSFFTFGLSNAIDVLENYEAQIGKVVVLNSKGTVRLNLSLGLAYTEYRTAYNFEKLNSTGLFSGNYSFDYNEGSTFSLIVNPKIEFPFFQFYGISCSPLMILNEHHSYFGVGIEQMLGLIRKKRKP